MQQADDTEVFRQLREGRTLFGDGWRCVDSFDEVDDELESDEEEVSRAEDRQRQPGLTSKEYVVMDLGTAMDARTLQTEATYQLIGMDTPMPFLKIGEHIFQGTVAPLIGDEVVFDVERQEEDPQHPRHRPAYKTRNRVELRGVNLTLRSERQAAAAGTGGAPNGAEASGSSAVMDASVRNFFPQRTRRRKTTEDGEGGEGDVSMDMDWDEEQVLGLQTPKAGPSGLRHSTLPLEGDDIEMDDSERQRAVDSLLHTQRPFMTPTAASALASTPASALPLHISQLQAQSSPGTPTGAGSSAPGTPTPGTGEKTRTRTRKSVTRATLAVSTMTDLADIHHAGGLGDVRLEIADDATPELLAAVTAIRGKPSGPGTKLSRAQEERLVRGLPASGPGSRGGRGSRGRGAPYSGRGGRGGRGRGRGGVASSFVHPAGEGLGDEFLALVGQEGWEEGESGVDASGTGFGESAVPTGAVPAAGGSEVAEGSQEVTPAAAAAAAAVPESPSPLRRVDSDEELRAIDDE